MADELGGNKKLVSGYIEEVWNKGNLASIEKYLAPNFKLTNARKAGADGPEAVRHFAGALRKAVPNLHYDIEHVIAEGDHVVVRVSSGGQQTAEAAKAVRVDKHSKLYGVMGFQVSGGKIVSAWQHWDQHPSPEALSI